MLSRKLFTALLVVLCIDLFLATTEVMLNDAAEPFIILMLILSIYVVPVVLFYGVLTSILADVLSSKYTQFVHLLSFSFHIVFGLLLLVPLNLFTLVVHKEFFGMHGVYILFFGVAGGLFYIIDRIVKYFWDKADVSRGIIVINTED